MEYNSLAKIFEWELVEEKPLVIFPESMIPIKPDSDCECIPYSGVSVIQTTKDGETRNIWNDDIAIDHIVALREDNTILLKERACKGTRAGNWETRIFSETAASNKGRAVQSHRREIRMGTIPGSAVSD